MNVRVFLVFRAWNNLTSASTVNSGEVPGPTSASTAVITPSKISRGDCVSPVKTLIGAPSTVGLRAVPPNPAPPSGAEITSDKTSSSDERPPAASRILMRTMFRVSAGMSRPEIRTVGRVLMTVSVVSVAMA